MLIKKEINQEKENIVSRKYSCDSKEMKQFYELYNNQLSENSSKILNISSKFKIWFQIFGFLDLWFFNPTE